MESVFFQDLPWAPLPGSVILLTTFHCNHVLCFPLDGSGKTCGFLFACLFVFIWLTVRCRVVLNSLFPSWHMGLGKALLLLLFTCLICVYFFLHPCPLNFPVSLGLFVSYVLAKYITYLCACVLLSCVNRCYVFFCFLLKFLSTHI